MHVCVFASFHIKLTCLILTLFYVALPFRATVATLVAFPDCLPHSMSLMNCQGKSLPFSAYQQSLEAKSCTHPFGSLFKLSVKTVHPSMCFTYFAFKSEVEYKKFLEIKGARNNDGERTERGGKAEQK